MAAVLLSSVGAMAQHAVGGITLQPRAGLSVANIADTKGDPRYGVVGGADFEYQANDWLGISAGAVYSQQGYKKDGATAKIDYINIPLMGHFYVAKGLPLNVGVQPGFKVSNKITSGSVTYDVTNNDAVETFDFSMPVGLAYELPSVPLVFDARYNFGFTDAWKAGDNHPQNQVFQFTVGYKFDL